MPRDRRPSSQTMAVLDALAERPRDWRHGYDLCRELNLKAGSMYPILMRLADRGLLETSWETGVEGSRPPRHLYRITRAGLDFVAELRAEPRAREARLTLQSQSA